MSKCEHGFERCGVCHDFNGILWPKKKIEQLEKENEALREYNLELQFQNNLFMKADKEKQQTIDKLKGLLLEASDDLYDAYPIDTGEECRYRKAVEGVE